jgi:REP element-mobilizing transposase RayT
LAFHLADSLPKGALDQLEEAINELPVDARALERRKQIEAWIDAGYGSCALRDPRAAAIVQDALLFFDASRYRLMAWVVMPNHVHVLFEPLPAWSVARIVATWKKFTARKISTSQGAGILGTSRSAGVPGTLVAGGAVAVAPQSAGVPGTADLQIGSGKGRSTAFWHREYWDRYIRNERHFRQAVQYIHENPVKAGLVSKPEGWRWSSAYNPTGTL